jgi:nitrogen regulatory protein PII
VEAAAKAGSKGATIINARGSGIHETSRLFAMDIEPEKEIVLIVSDSDSTDHIVASIRENFQIEKPGNGIVFVQNVTQAYGLFDN